MRLINWPASSIIWSKLDRLMMKPSLPNSKLVTKNVACRGYKLKHDKWVTPLCRRMPRRTPDTQFLKRGVPFGCFATFQVHCVFTNPTVLPAELRISDLTEDISRVSLIRLGE